ncbi:MAG TPA: acyl carrier protein [Anaerolineaceae bacterium]|jgi:acyl carrier protein|nr:acyl carrier protein [Anaerolineaceae bacterium]HNW94739.1 acyl carrier protein [Anaerolineaceae bacterium]HPS32387.1 acyl carrier protein [Anaerolineaceae bacterium]
METAEMKSRMNKVFREVFDNPGIEIFDGMTSSDVVGWDSFSHINLITSLEIEFDIEFSQAEAFGFKTVGELQKAILRKMSA